MGKGWNASFHLGRRERLRQEVLHRVAGGPRPAPRDYILRSAVISLITFAGHVKSAALPVPGVFRHGKAVAQSG